MKNMCSGRRVRMSTQSSQQKAMHPTSRKHELKPQGEKHITLQYRRCTVEITAPLSLRFSHQQKPVIYAFSSSVICCFHRAEFPPKDKGALNVSQQDFRVSDWPQTVDESAATVNNSNKLRSRRRVSPLLENPLFHHCTNGFCLRLQ